MAQSDPNEAVRWIALQMRDSFAASDSEALGFLMRYKGSDMAFGATTNSVFILTMLNILSKLNTKAKEWKEIQDSCGFDAEIVSATDLKKEFGALNTKLIDISLAEMNRREDPIDLNDVGFEDLKDFTEINLALKNLIKVSWDGLSTWMDIDTSRNG